MKVLCSKCGKVIDNVKQSDQYVFCNDCGNNTPTKDGRNLFIKRYNYLVALGNRDLMTNKNLDEGEKCFTEALKMVPNDFGSIITLCLIKMTKGTFENPNFKEVINVFDQYEIILNPDNSMYFLSFVEDCIEKIKKFNDEVKTRLFQEGKLIHAKYIDYLENDYKEVVELAKFLLESIDLCTEEEVAKFCEDTPLKDMLNEIIADATAKIDANYELVEHQEVLEDELLNPQIAKKPMNLKLFYSGVILMAVVGLALILLGAVLGNTMFYYISIAPFAIGVGLFLFVFLKTRKKE